MKKLLFFLLAIIFAIQGWSQTTLNEGFEGTTFPPDDWAKVTTQGTEAWERYTSSSPRGLACASVNYDDPSHINYLITPKLIVSSDQDSIVYWVKTSYDFGGTTLNVLVSTTDNAVASFSTTSLQTVSTLSESWVRKSIPLTNYIGEEIYIAFQVVDFYGSRVMLDDVTGPELFVPTCPRPTALSASNPTTTGVDLGWTDDTGSIWNIEYMLATETDWTNATTLYSVMNPHTFTSLNASTSYKARVQTDCGIEQSDWTSPITFMTACDPITVLPYSDSFDTYGTVTGSFPPCWSRPVLNTTTPFPSIETTNNSAPASIKFQSSSASAPTYVITPQFADDINLLRVKFFLKREGANSGTMEVGVMSDPNDLTSFELVATVDPSLNDWIEYEILFSGTDITGPNNYIAFRHITNLSNWFYWLDDVIVDYIPSCSKPGTIDAENITTTSADITWVPANQTDYAWWLYYKESSANDFDSVYISGLPTYSFTTLNPSTGYEVYLKTDCSSELSEETSIFSFRTECGEITSFPWMENFDSYGAAGAFPPCWHRPVIYSTYPKTSTTASGVHSAPASLEIHSAVGAPTYAITPELGEDINLLKVNFWAMAESTSSSGTIEVGVMSDPTDLTTFESVQIIQPTNTAYNEYDIDFSQTTLSGIGNYIAFRQNTVSAIYYYWIDDVVVDYIPSCPRPDSVFSTSITQTYADIDIVPGDIGDTQWKIYHREVGTSTWTEDDVFAFPYQITGLTSNTPYEVFVKTLCSDATYSDGSTILNFHTPCENIITLPYTENFDTYGTGTAATSYPTCWSRNVSNYSTINYPYISTTNFSPPGAMYFYSYNNTRVVAVCNPIDISIPINTLTVEFKMYFSTVDAAGIQVGVMDDPNDFTTFVPVGSPQVISATSVWEDKVVILNDYAGTGQYIALAAIAPASEYARAYVDDFKIDYTPDCPDVYGLTVGAASTTSVSVNWDNSFDDGTGFNVAYASNVVGTFDPATSMIIPIPSGTTLPYTIPGFNPGDSIWVAVQRGCLGNWSEAQKINLPEFANQLPFYADFEDALLDDIWTITNGTQTNKWYIGVPGANDSDPTDGIDERGLYISSDNGATATYSSASSSIVFVSTLVEFDNSPEFVLSFDWANNGEIDWHDLNVYLMPLSIALTPGTLPNSQYQINTASLAEETSFHTFTRVFDGSYSNSVKQLVFAWQNDDYGNYNPPARVDNISLVGLSCPSTTNLVADNITTTTADISWDSNLPTVSDWWIYWKQRSASSWTDSLNITNNPYTLSGLLPNTPYEVAIVNNCGTELSNPMNILEFRTSCDAISVLPYFEDFDTYGTGTSVMPACWTRTTTYADRPYVNSGGYSGNYLYFYAGTAGTYNIAAMTPIDASIPINTLMAAFYYKYSSATNILIVGVMTDPTDASTFDSVTTIQGTSSWAEYEVNFSSYTGSGEYIAFLVPYTTTDNYGYLDELVVDYIPACDRPSALSAAPSASGIGTDMDVSFTPAQPTDTEWYIFYKEASSSVWDSVYTTTTTTTIPGLTLQTAYNIYVKTVCLDGSYSRATAIITYATPCFTGAITSFPWIEGFESGLICWQQEYVSGTTDWTTTSSDNDPNTGTGFANFYNTSGGKTKLISPVLDISGLASPYVSFWHMQEDWLSDQDELKVFYRANNTDAWVELAHYTASIASYQLDSVALPAPSATYQIAFEGFGDFGYGVALDDITVYDPSGSSCAAPTDLVVNALNTSASITWTPSGSEVSWEVKLNSDGTPEIVGSPSKTFTGLTPNTNYTAFVRSNCGDGTSSAWISAPFTTSNVQTPPVVSTTVPNAQITQTTAVFNASFVQGSDPILTRGFDYKKATDANWNNVNVTDETNPFTYSATELIANTQYLVRGFVSTATEGVVVGDTATFTTLAIIPPTVTTDTVITNTDAASAVFQGTTSQGTDAIIARGFEYKLLADDWSTAIDLTASGSANITATVTGLSAVKYQVRAYAETLDGGKTYGDILDFNMSTSINSIDTDNLNVNLYPNPASNNTTLSIKGVNGKVKISITDVQGRIVSTIERESSNGEVNHSINLEAYAKGVYYIRIQSDSSIKTQKLIVQ